MVFGWRDCGCDGVDGRFLLGLGKWERETYRVGWIDESIEDLLLHVHVVCRRCLSTAARSYGKIHRLRMNGRSKRQKKVELFKAAG